MIQLVYGRYYKSRDGSKVGPLYYQGKGYNYPWIGCFNGNEEIKNTFRDDGTAGLDPDFEHPHDLMEEWLDVDDRPSKPIDELNYLDFRKGIAKLWKMGRAF